MDGFYFGSNHFGIQGFVPSNMVALIPVIKLLSYP